jgi:hypothetical protein
MGSRHVNVRAAAQWALARIIQAAREPSEEAALERDRRSRDRRSAPLTLAYVDGYPAV